MKKLILITATFILVSNTLFAQQSQPNEDPFFYQISGLVYVYEFDLTNRDKTDTHKIPKEPLKFKIASKETDANDNSTYYVIKFIAITPETGTIASLIGSNTFVNSSDNDKYFWLRKDELDNYLADGFIKKSYKIPNLNATYGANLALPFKLRPKTSGQNIKLIPELTLGGYLGLKWRISHSEPFYFSFPVITLGLATLNINDNNSTATPDKGDGTVLGITGSWGGIFQLKDFQFGVMMGWDRAAGELGKEWIYNDKSWYSFSIGYSFLGNTTADKEKKNSNP